ncbi:manganese-binding transcriptional regulator MntR [Alphaproteobacteria bacterium]|nr:manganese-binding transcriptional regulator MntR [Alphaproteobacteria bacterium]MDB4233692.1 manganese-binding transcriptional regulator MntR [Alphaproteobacteria bacterium]
MVESRYRGPKQYLKIREQNSSEMLEDYVETIGDLISKNGEARNADLADHFGVSQATINKNIKRLIAFDLVKTEPYRSIFLTPKGNLLADASRKKHEIVLKFLLKLGVPNKIAEEDSEGIEHHVSPETLNIMKKFIIS